MCLNPNPCMFTLMHTGTNVHLEHMMQAQFRQLITLSMTVLYLGSVRSSPLGTTASSKCLEPELLTAASSLPPPSELDGCPGSRPPTSGLKSLMICCKPASSWPWICPECLLSTSLLVLQLVPGAPSSCTPLLAATERRWGCRLCRFVAERQVRAGRAVLAFVE